MSRFLYDLLNTPRGMAVRRSYNRWRTRLKSFNPKRLLYQFFTHPYVVIPGVFTILFVAAATALIMYLDYKRRLVVITTVPQTVQNLKNIGAAYQRATKKLEHPPASIDELKPFLSEFGEYDKVTRSPDDGQPYVMFFNIDNARFIKMGNPIPVVAHEQHGKGGRRYVLRGRSVWHVTDDEFKMLPLPR